MTYRFHFAPARGWMNDPNGLIDEGGLHHLFYQYNPAAPVFGNIHWGHATSTDFITWTEQPVALSPGRPGSFDDAGCYSGCAVRGDSGQIVIIYSGHRSSGEMPGMATPLDAALNRWVKAAENPIVRERPPVPGLRDFRDHSVWRHGTVWNQAIAATGSEGGSIVVYESEDLSAWDYRGVLIGAREAGLPDGTWECPDVFEINGWTLIVFSRAVGSVRDVYWVAGKMEEDEFTAIRYGRVDGGSLFYAPQSYQTSDGRRVMFGWLQMHRDASAIGGDSIGAQSVARELSVRNGVLHQSPVAEVDRHRGPVMAVLDVTHTEDSVVEINATTALEVALEAAPGHTVSDYELTLADPMMEEITLPLHKLVGPGYFERIGAEWQPRASRAGSIRVIFDAGIIEIFADDGRALACSNARMKSVSTIAVRLLRAETVESGPGLIRVADMSGTDPTLAPIETDSVVSLVDDF